MPLTVLLIGDHPLWASLQTALGADYTVQILTQAEAYMPTLMAEQPVLVLVDGTQAEWWRWTSLPKSSPVTRRIPIVLLSDDEAARARAMKQGADAAVAFADADPVTLISTYAALPDAALEEQLACACREPLPALAQQAIERFNAGEYYRQHDLLEELWMHTPGPERNLYQGILQVGIAYYQMERANVRGARKMLQRALQWLRRLPDVCQGVDVADLRHNAETILDLLNRDDFSIADFDRSLLRPVRYPVASEEGERDRSF